MNLKKYLERFITRVLQPAIFLLVGLVFLYWARPWLGPILESEIGARLVRIFVGVIVIICIWGAISKDKS